MKSFGGSGLHRGDRYSPCSKSHPEKLDCFIDYLLPLLLCPSTVKVREIICVGFLTGQLRQVPDDGQRGTGELIFVIAYILSGKYMQNTSRSLTLLDY